MTLDQRYWIWDLVLLLALAVALRVHDLGTLSFNVSEVRTALAARCYLHPENRTYQRLSLHSSSDPLEWLVVQTTRVFGDSEWSARFPSVLAGALATIWIYLWGSHWFGAWVGRISGLLFALWPWSVACGRMATDDSLLLFLSFLFAISVWKILEGNCLGHPLTEPPLISGRKPLVPARFLKILPLVILGFLCLLLTPAALGVLLLLPGYLFARLAWSWLRGKTGDCEFKRSLLYLAAAVAYIATATVFVFWHDPGFFETLMSRKPGNTWLMWVSHAGWPELILGGFLLVGTGMAALSGRQGWLVMMGAWGPPLGVALLPFPADTIALYPSVLFMLLLLSMPIAWAFEVVRESVNHWAVEKQHLSWRFVASIPIFVGGLLLISWYVLLSPKGTTAVLNGTAEETAGESVDWRMMASFLPQIGIRAAVVTVDPLLCLYYLERADFRFPQPLARASGQDSLAAIPLFPDGRALLDFIDSGHEVWILGARSSFEETLNSSDGAVLWARLTQPPAWVWEGPAEIVICWRGGGR